MTVPNFYPGWQGGSGYRNRLSAWRSSGGESLLKSGVTCLLDSKTYNLKNVPNFPPKTIGGLFFACSEEIKDLSLIEALQRLLALALDAVRSSGEFAESVIAAMIDAIMGVAIELIQTGRRLGKSTHAFSTI
jgi:hypothetical protein